MKRSIGRNLPSRWSQEMDMVDWCPERRENRETSSHKNLKFGYDGAEFNLKILFR